MAHDSLQPIDVNGVNGHWRFVQLKQTGRGQSVVPGFLQKQMSPFAFMAQPRRASEIGSPSGTISKKPRFLIERIMLTRLRK